MNIIFGFPHKEKLMSEIIRGLTKLLRSAPSGELEAHVEAFAEEFSNDEDEELWIERVVDQGNCDQWPGACRVVSGHLSYTQRDHPLSPDGMAMLQVPFGLLLLDDAVFGKRLFVDDGLG